MYKTIMVPTDGSGFDREAIRVALRIAESCQAKLKLVRVLSTGSFFGMASASEGTAVAADVARSERDKALSGLYALAGECRGSSDADISVDLHAGPVADVLESYARRHDVDLIVMSTHARSGLARVALGSVTDSLIRHTSIPVLVVKPRQNYLNPRAGKAFRRMVVPLDGSALAEQILPRVTNLATLEGAEVVLLHVLVSPSYLRDEIPSPWDEDIAAAEEYLLRTAKRLRCSGVVVRMDIVISENVAEATADFAARENADLIAIATHGRSGLVRMLRGSVADAIMRSGTASMLVLKPEKVTAGETTMSADWTFSDLVPA